MSRRSVKPNEHPSIAAAAAGLAEVPAAPFTAAEVEGLPEPVARYSRASLREGRSPPTAVRLRMRGQIRVGRWLPFTAEEVLAPRAGFVWRVRVAGVLVTGTDHYLDGAGATRMRLLGLVPVVNAGGDDVSRSAAGRAAAESLWVPGSVLPRTGAAWEAEGHDRAVVRFSVDDVPAVIHYEFDDAGRIRGGYIERWGDPDSRGTFGWHRCGGVVTAYRTFGSVTIPTPDALGGTTERPARASSSATRSPASDRW